MAHCGQSPAQYPDCIRSGDGNKSNLSRHILYVTETAVYNSNFRMENSCEFFAEFHWSTLHLAAECPAEISGILKTAQRRDIGNFQSGRTGQ